MNSFVRNTLRKRLLEEYNGYISWDDLNDEVKTDIIENIYNNSAYLQSEWNIWTFKENLEDCTELPKFKIEYKNVDELYKQLIKHGWGINEKQVNYLVNVLNNGGELNPIIINNDEFFDGGHRLTAYKIAKRELIPTIDIGALLNMNWQKWTDDEINLCN